MRQIRHQSAEQNNTEESPSSIDLLGDEIGCLRHCHLIRQPARCAPLGTSASAVSIIPGNWTSRKAIPWYSLKRPIRQRFGFSFGGESATFAREGCWTR